MGNVLGARPTKRKCHRDDQDSESDDDFSHHATTSLGPSGRKKSRLCVCAGSTKDDNKIQGGEMKKKKTNRKKKNKKTKSNVFNVEDTSCSSNPVSNTQVSSSSTPEETATCNATNKITAEDGALSTSASTNIIETTSVSVIATKDAKIDKTSTAPKAAQVTVTAAKDAKLVEAPTPPQAATTPTTAPRVATPPPTASEASKTPAAATNTATTTPTAPQATTPITLTILDTETSVDQRIHLHKLEETYANFLREEFIFPHVNKGAFLSAGLTVERGFLLHGSTHEMLGVVHAFANELSRVYGKKTRMFTRTPQDLFRTYSTESEEFMKRILNSVKACAEDTPIIILIQDLRSFIMYCNLLKRPESSPLVTLSNLFKTYLGSSSKYKRLFVIGMVDNLGVVPVTLIGTGMFAKSLAFSDHIDEAKRMSHLKEAVKKWSVQPDDKLLEEMAKKTDGFTPPQLHELVQSVQKSAISSRVKKLVQSSCSKCLEDPQSLKANVGELTSIKPTAEDWEMILKTKLKQAKNLSTTAVDTDITFSSVGGLDEQIKYLRENVILPLKKKDVLKEWGVEPVRGIIFYGPPGTGKTLLAKAMANELNKVTEDDFKEIASTSTLPTTDKKYSFFYRKATDCFNKYVGETERILRELFTKAQAEAPSLIFFDEFDGLCPTRTNGNIQFYTTVVTTLLGLMDSVKRGDILVIAATNRLESLDPAIRRAGRFDRAVGFPMPGKEGRENILRVHTKSWKNGNGKEILEQMAEKTVGYSGADLENLARETLLLGMRRLLEAKSADLNVNPEDWHTALSSVKPSNNSGKIEFGSGATFLEPVPAGVKLLLQTNVTKIEEKLQPIFTDIKENKSAVCSGGLNSFLVCSRSEHDDAVDRYLVPLLLTDSKLFKDVAPYTLDLSDVQRLTKDGIQTTLSQLRSPPDGKISLLLVPQIEMFIKMKKSSANAGGIVDYVLTQLQTLRGKNIILLATSKLALNKVHEIEEILTMFKDVEGSKFHEFIQPSQPELETFFKTIPRLEKEFSKQLEYVVKFGEGKDVETLLDLYAELQRLLQEKKGEENKTDESILQQLKGLFNAFDNHKKMCRNDFQLYI